MRCYFFILIIYSISSFAVELDLDLLRKKIRNTSNILVTYNNHLGEGEGHFDSTPRYSEKFVNCTTWWQQVLAESYSDGSRKDIVNILDSIRYFNGAVSFGTRKHFLDHAFNFDLPPFEKVDKILSTNCKDDLSHTLILDIKKFKKSRKYQCPLLFEEDTEMKFSYLSKEKSLSCMKSLPDGIYMVFPVAGRRYNQIWGRKSGPMGRVHGLMVDKHKGNSQVFHASIEKGKVLSEPFERYVNGMGSRLFKGYSIFSISNTYMAKKISDQGKIKKILECEKNLHQKGRFDSLND